jgi:hypothetical protein
MVALRQEGIRWAAAADPSSTAFEELHRAFVLLSLGARSEGAEISTSPGLRILLPRIQPVLTGRQLSNHGNTCFR